MDAQGKNPLGEALASNAEPDSAAPVQASSASSVAPLAANCPTFMQRMPDWSDWALHVGPFSLSSGGAWEMKPQLKLGGQVGQFKAEGGFSDLRDGMRFDMRAQAHVEAVGHGNSLAELHENIKCDTPGFKEALEQAKRLLARSESSSAMVGIAQRLGIPTVQLERLLAGEVSWPERLRSVRPGEGVMDLKVKAHTGFGLSWMVCLGWCDTKGYHMMGVGMEAAAGVTAGGQVFAGKHKNGDSIRIILGIMNFTFEYTCPLAPLARETLLAEPAPPPTNSIGSNSSAIAAKEVCIFPGFTEHAYRLVFPFEDRFAPATPHLMTVMPSGVVETTAILKAQKEEALIAFTYPQTISDELAESRVSLKPGECKIPIDSTPPTLCETPFVWRRDDGTNALVQTWPTSLNDKFRKTFEISEGTNPDSDKFQPQAVSEYQTAMKELFGPGAASCPILYCHKKTENKSPAVVGTSEDVLAHLKTNPELMQQLTILSIDSEGLGFVSDGTEGNGKKFEKHFTLTPGEQTVVYQKVGWDTMGCTKPLDQFLRDAEMHGPPMVQALSA